MRKQFLLNFDENQADRIQRVADYLKLETGFKLSMTAIIRRAVDEYLDTFERQRGLEKN